MLPSDAVPVRSGCTMRRFVSETGWTLLREGIYPFLCRMLYNDLHCDFTARFMLFSLSSRPFGDNRVRNVTVRKWVHCGELQKVVSY